MGVKYLARWIKTLKTNAFNKHCIRALVFYTVHLNFIKYCMTWRIPSCQVPQVTKIISNTAETRSPLGDEHQNPPALITLTLLILVLIYSAVIWLMCLCGSSPIGRSSLVFPLEQMRWILRQSMPRHVRICCCCCCCPQGAIRSTIRGNYRAHYLTYQNKNNTGILY